jgi:hypothetical protein
MSSDAMFGHYLSAPSSSCSALNDLRLTLPKEPVPSVRPTMYCPMRGGLLDGCCERDLPGAAGTGRVDIALNGGLVIWGWSLMVYMYLIESVSMIMV